MPSGDARRGTPRSRDSASEPSTRQNLAGLLDEVVRTAAQTLGASHAGVFEFVGDRRSVRCRASVGFETPASDLVPEPGECALAASFVDLTGPVAVDDLATDSRFGPEAFVRRAGLGSLVAAPLHADLRPLGFVLVGSDRPRRFAHDDGLFVQLVANIAAAAIGRRQVEESFRVSEAGYRHILDTASEGICAFNADGRMTYVNRRAAEMLGYSVAEVLGRPLAEFLFEDDLAQVPAILGRTADQTPAVRLPAPMPRRQRVVGARLDQPDPRPAGRFPARS